MKNLTYTLAGLSGVVMVLMTAAWAQNPPPAIGARPAPVAAPAPVAPQPAAPANAAAPATVGAIEMPASVAAPVAMTTQETVAEMKKSIENAFTEELSFPLTESKMIAFIRAANKVEKVNSKWDVQIASAETDQMAIEYNNFAVEEINTTLKTLDGITFPEYQALTKLTVDNKEFNKIYLAYKQLVQEKYFGEAVKPATPATPVTATPAPVAVKPAAAAATTATTTAPKPPAASSNPGIVPKPLGSPVPPYSKP